MDLCLLVILLSCLQKHKIEVKFFTLLSIYDFLPSGVISGHAITFIDALLLPGLAVFLKLTQFTNVYFQSFSLTILPWGV